MTLEARVEEVVRFARPLGFFEDEAGSDAEVARRLAAELRHEWGEDAQEGPGFDALVLALDPARVWWRDTECGAFEGEGQYEAWTRGLAGIMRGAVPLTAVHESWGPPDKDRMHVTLTVQGRRRVVVRAGGWGDFVHAEPILEALNRLAPRRGPHLLTRPPDGQDVYALALTRVERRAFEARGWRFFDLEAARAAHERRKRKEAGSALRAWWDRFWWPFRA